MWAGWSLGNHAFNMLSKNIILKMVDISNFGIKAGSFKNLATVAGINLNKIAFTVLPAVTSAIKTI